MAQDELPHSTILDASKRAAFRKSVATDSIPDEYFVTNPSNY